MDYSFTCLSSSVNAHFLLGMVRPRLVPSWERAGSFQCLALYACTPVGPENTGRSWPLDSLLALPQTHSEASDKSLFSLDLSLPNWKIRELDPVLQGSSSCDILQTREEAKFSWHFHTLIKCFLLFPRAVGVPSCPFGRRQGSLQITSVDSAATQKRSNLDWPVLIISFGHTT